MRISDEKFKQIENLLKEGLELDGGHSSFVSIKKHLCLSEIKEILQEVKLEETIAQKWLDL